MDGQAQESVIQNLLTPEALIDFIEELRHSGFNIGMAEYIAAQDLLLMLISRGERLDDSRRIASLFGPLLCSTSAEQNAFHEYLVRWAKRYKPVLRDQVAAHKQTISEALDETTRRGLRLEWILFIGIVVVLLFFSLLINNVNEIKPNVTPGQIVTKPIPPISDETKTALEIAGMTIIILGGAYLIWIAAWKNNAQQFLQRRQSDTVPEVKQISISASDEVLFPSLTFLSVARLLRKRVQIGSQEMNIAGTVERSVEHGGWLTPVYGNFLIPPEYLILVDRRSRFDHLAQFMETMIKHLEEHGVFITMYTFDADPRLCFPLRGSNLPQSLNEIARRHENMRLIIFTEAEGLLEPTSGRLAAWTRLFNRWIHRAVLTPEPPMYWGASENEVGHEFTVLPGTEVGLASFMGIIQGEERTGDLSTWEDSALPSILLEHPQRLIARDAPSIDQIDSLLMELRRYLGDDGYTWLCACAVYPELHWQITISLGRLLKGEDTKSLLDPRRLAELARLPWFRYGTMPDWLRMRLIFDLPPNQETEVRAILEALLVSAVEGDGEALELEIAYERREWTSRLARSLLRLLRRNNPDDDLIRDRVFLDFMFQRLNLAVRVPEALRRQFLNRKDYQSGWKLLFQRRNAGLHLPNSGPASIFRIWLNALTRPTVRTFTVISELPNAKATTAFWWVFFSSSISAVINLFFGLSGDLFGQTLGSSLIFEIFYVPISGFISATFFLIGTALVQWLAKLFGGRGSFNQLSYAIGAIFAPLNLITAGIALLFKIVGFSYTFYTIIIILVSILELIYLYILRVMAVKSVHKFGWWRAIGSEFIPILVIVLVCSCLIGFTLAILAPSIANTFNSISTGIP